MLVLDAHAYRVELSPEFGGTLLTARWTRPDGRQVPLLAPLVQPQQGLKSGSFVMAPFANRIAGGRFVFGGQVFQVPVNRPEENMACHGYSRERQWQVVESTSDRVLLVDEVSSDQHPWRYRIEQEVTLSTRGIEVRLSLRNDGDRTLPFGMGLHPWFPRSPATTISFSAAGYFPRDAQGLPAGERRQHEALGLGHAEQPEHWLGLDLAFADWAPRTARIEWPDQQAGMLLAADGALKHLHVYMPADRDVFCAEPVSHLPDALNRPGLGASAAMTPLKPGESLTGKMSLSAFALIP